MREINLFLIYLITLKCFIYLQSLQ